MWMLLVCASYVSLPSPGYLTSALPEGDRPLDSALVQEYKDIFIRLGKWGALKHSGIYGNGLREYRTRTRVPDFVAEFE